jgi:hypothetical protein
MLEVTENVRLRLLEDLPPEQELLRALLAHLDYVKSETLTEKLYLVIG